MGKIANLIQSLSITSSDEEGDHTTTPAPKYGDVVRVSVTTAPPASLSSKKRDVMITVTPPSTQARANVDLVCVIDTSGSMSTEAVLKDENGKSETHGLSLLDVVKHALRTVIASLKKGDRVAIVPFEGKASIAIQLTDVVKGKAQLLKVVEELQPGGCTNIWDGLHTGLEIIREKARSDCIPSIFLLTDGQPNVNPPKGHIPMLRNYKDKHANVAFNLSTFGFGYSLDSVLLDNLAREGMGRYAFIPDSTFVGTVFVHAISNMLSTCCRKMFVSIQSNGAELSNADTELGPWGSEGRVTSWGAEIDISAVQYGQNKTIILPVIDQDTGRDTVDVGTEADNAGVIVKVTYETVTGKKLAVDAKAVAYDTNQDLELNVNRIRQLLIKRCLEAFRSLVSEQEGSYSRTVENEDLVKAFKIIKALIVEAEAIKSESPKDERIEGMLSDIKGQISEAFSRPAYFTRWGRHYIPSIVRAHQLQECNNFKDPGVQNYGGDLFTSLRDEADDIFVKLPPPKPSKPVTKNTKTIRNMSRYHTASGGCFAGHNLATMADGSLKRLDQIRKGDKVLGGDVLCVVETICKDGIADLVDIGDTGLEATAYHPIQWNGKWTFPVDVFEVKLRMCPAVYSFALTKGSAGDIIINGVPCVALAHGLNDSLPKDDVRRHDFWGTDNVLRALMDMPGGEEGHVTLHTGCLIRDQGTGLVCGLDHTAGRNAKPVLRGEATSAKETVMA
eukprot:TRINITY_DN799_c0_g3_i2.p1 TRINITY_DN799_c0_g3~~TRINITY_DN799_c0_g3_i2.p1  ORF type:complete len:730 (-),score=183.45 TRINITY_DN799_c0_g3_i2:555-2744(-)